MRHQTQQLLPIFPKDMGFINHLLGVQEKEGTVWYFHSGAPIFSHDKDDLNSFRYITSNLILMGRCRNKDIIEFFGVSSDSVRRWKKIFQNGGNKAIFRTDGRRGHSHKLIPEVLERIQGKLDKNQSVNSIAKEEGISEGAIRYAIDQGRLKKKVFRSKSKGSNTQSAK